jgi:hypothetical protein
LSLEMLEVKGWRWYETKKGREKDENCFIDPEGKWYSIGVCNHNQFAFAVFKEFNPRDYTAEGMHRFIESDIRGACKWLLDHGWIYIESTFAMGTIVRGYEHMSKKTV